MTVGLRRKIVSTGAVLRRRTILVDFPRGLLGRFMNDDVRGLKWLGRVEDSGIPVLSVQSEKRLS